MIDKVWAFHVVEGYFGDYEPLTSELLVVESERVNAAIDEFFGRAASGAGRFDVLHIHVDDGRDYCLYCKGGKVLLRLNSGACSTDLLVRTTAAQVKRIVRYQGCIND